MNYPNCPVCGFNEMPYAPIPYHICPCCGTEFGVDDHRETYLALRQEWIRDGMPWFDDITSPRREWSAALQLIKAGYVADLIAPTGSATRTERDNISVDTRRLDITLVSATA